MIKRFALFLIVLLFVSTGLALPANASSKAQNTVDIYLFWGDGCPHCAKAKPFLQQLDESSDNVNLHMYEVYHNSVNQKLLQDVTSYLGVKSSGVPVTIVGDEAFIGYSGDSSGLPIKDRVNECLASGCQDTVKDVISGKTVQKTVNTQNSQSSTVDLPIFGKVNVRDFSLPVLTVIIAALDGFNPCAMWTLVFLITLLFGMESRRRMWALGSSFIVASAVVYFLFMTAWLSVFSFIGYVSWIKILIGLVALGAGGYYLYDFYKNKSGTCKVTADPKRKKIFEKLKDITHRSSFWLALVGIVLLAFAVNAVELVCSAGLPAVYTSILSNSGLAWWQQFLYLLLYILIFMADDLFVFLMAMFTMQLVGVHAKYARYSHLVGGIVMIILGFLLIFAPQLLMFG